MAQSNERSAYLFTLFLALRDLPQERWRPELTGRGTKPELAAEVLRMLLDHQQCKKYELVVGMVFNERYVLEKRLGEGSSAEVWSAHDIKLQCKVSLKIFNREQSGPRDPGRALEEARHASDIESEHVVRIRDVACCEASGLRYIVMDLLGDFAAGRWTYAESMKEAVPSDRAELLRWLIQAAQGVHAAHARRVFHRDIKPENIMIRPNRTAVVTDFGLAVRTFSGSELGQIVDQSERRAPGPGHAACRAVGGTPSYMAPEQVELLLHKTGSERMEEDRWLVRADVYALGAVLYEKLAHRPPYRSRLGAEHAVMDILTQVRTSAPPPLRACSSSNGEPQRVSRRLEHIVAKAMARDPEARYANAAAFADDLRCYLERKPTSLERADFKRATSLRMLSLMEGSIGPALAAAAALLVLFGIRPGTPGGGRPAIQSREPISDSANARPAEVPVDSASRSGLSAALPLRAPAFARSPDPRLSRTLRAARDAKGARGSRRMRAAPVEAAAAAGVESLPAFLETKAAAGLSQQPMLAARVINSSVVPQPLPVSNQLSAAPPAPPALSAPSAGDPAAFIQRAQRDPSRLTRVDLGSRPGRAYCLVNAKGSRAVLCLHQPLLSPEAATVLAKAHKRSGVERTWVADSGGNVVQACQTLTPPGSYVRRSVCSELSIKNVLPPPGGLLRIDSTRLAVARM